MTLQTVLGHAASRLESAAAGLLIGLAAGAVLLGGSAHAAEAPAANTLAQAAPAPIARAPGDGPALWVVRDADSTVYLYGAIHMLKPGTAWGSDKVDAAFDSASELWLEIANPDDQSELGPIFQQYGVAPGRPLSSWLTPDEKARLDAAVTGVGMSPAQIDPVRPWLAALMIGTGPMKAAGYDTTLGVEMNLRARAQAAGKPVRGLEMIGQQVGGLARMSEEGQMVYLRHALSTWDRAAADLDAAVAGWLVGDEASMTRFAYENGRAISEETHQTFLARRNADWADQIQTLMQGSGVSFVAVGAAHLAGDDKLQDLLATRGLTVTRE
ncbi:TraB/GumN family protein [Brevundimonas sp.]|uniref:TraB/GumN family protein n=1 Tax=Brevundimonas sp. TaxID=1871086 RepID=UPI003F6F270F